MSTRANIIFKDSAGTKLYFYRHSDGYPDVTGADLKSFCLGYQKHLRDNSMQSSGWLIVWGREKMERYEGYEWKVGDYEPTHGIHSDVEFIYIIDLDAMILETREIKKSFWENPKLTNTKIIETYSISSNEGVIK